MSVAVIVPPAPLVSLELAKAHLRIDDGDSDALISAYIAAASANIDGPSGWLGRAISPQTLELRLDGFYAQDWAIGGGWAWDGSWTGDTWGLWPFSRIVLPFPPLIRVVSIAYEDLTGADQVLTPQGWTASDEGAEPAFGAGWPSGRVAANAVRIRYQAGYAAAGDLPDPPDLPAAAIPAAITAACLMMTGDLFANREAQQIDQSRGTAVANPTVDALLAPYRVWRV